MLRKIPTLAIDEFTQKKNIQWGTHDYFVTADPVNDLLRNFPLRQNCYMISICISGHLRIRVNGEEILYLADTLATFNPSTVIEGLEISDDYRCYLVIFKKSFLIETLNNIYFLERFRFLGNNGLQCKKLSENEKTTLLAQINSILIIQKDKNHPFRRDIIRNLIIILLYETEHVIGTDLQYQNLNHNFGQEKLLLDYQDLLKQHYHKERKLDFYAGKLHVSTQVLSNIVKNKTGQTAKKLIEEMVLSHAKVLLKSGEYNVSEVATLLNYTNVEEFSRFFKRKTGATALKFCKE
ncbi:helix-turn-helix transcriptional regulator [Sphingobacterium siyangense subsp. cladoniae]|uniref:helix-turn-helix domain-containing protein n=1 Tax=Sphingobacterium siyangense TaxID=459529 RepID=UPI0031F9F8B3